MKARLVSYLSSIKFQNEPQFGFRQNKCTKNALTKFVMNNNNKRIAVYTDLKKAFELLKNHEFFLDKLDQSGVRGVVGQVYSKRSIQLPQL